MMQVRCQVRPSPIHGHGVFADERIPKGTLLWKYVAGADQLFTKADVERSPDAVRSFLEHFAALIHPADNLPELTGRWLLCLDQAMFMNHHANPNYGRDHRAARDIQVGEEIVCADRRPDVIPHGSAGPIAGGAAGP